MTQISEIADFTMEKMYDLICKIIVDDESLETEVLPIKYGKNELNILWFVSEDHKNLIIKKGEQVILRNEKRKFTITEWFDEKQYRKALMMKFLEEHLEEEEVTEGR